MVGPAGLRKPVQAYLVCKDAEQAKQKFTTKAPVPEQFHEVNEYS